VCVEGELVGEGKPGPMATKLRQIYLKLAGIWAIRGRSQAGPPMPVIAIPI